MLRREPKDFLAAVLANEDEHISICDVISSSWWLTGMAIQEERLM